MIVRLVLVLMLLLPLGASAGLLQLPTGGGAAPACAGPYTIGGTPPYTIAGTSPYTICH
jgi:hypothetical protein